MALDRDRVVRAALELLDNEGLDGLTLRKIAAALDVKAPALYWHFHNKQQLLDEMATTMLKDAMAAPLPADASWQDLLRMQAAGFRRMLLSHRDGARLFGGTWVTDIEPVTAGEPLLAALVAGLGDLQRAVVATRTMNYFVIGFVLEEQGIVSPDGRRDPRFDPAARMERIDAERFPLTSASSAYVFADLDQAFRDGLEVIVAGIEARTAGRTID